MPSQTAIIAISVIVVIILCLSVMEWYYQREPMSNCQTDRNMSLMPRQYFGDADFNSGYYLMNDGYFSNGIPDDKIRELMCKSKLYRLSMMNDGNYTIWSENPYGGKDRSYIEWNPIYL